MSEKELKTRLVQKHDTQANWEKAVNFIPKLGEIVIYDQDESFSYSRIKVGDGVSNVNDLPFIDKAGAGEKVEGKKFTVGESQIAAMVGAEIFNDYENNIALFPYSHAEGYKTTAFMEGTHAEGRQTLAKGYYSHAEGYLTTVEGDYSHVEGYNTTATGDCSHVQGKFNIEDTNGVYAHIVGNGSGNTPSNAHTIDWDGNAWFAGDVYVGGAGQDDAAAQKLITEASFNKLADSALVDVSYYGVLPGEDCSETLQELIADGGEFYFPAGRYEFYNVEITKDTVFRLHPEAEFHSEQSTRMIKAFECSFSMFGGKVSSGTEYPDRANTPYLHESRVRIASEYYGIIVLYGCHDCVIEGVTVPYSSHSSVFMVYGDHSGEDGKDRSVNVKVGGEFRNPARSKNISFRRCSFNNFLLAAIAIRYGNDNILIENCSFKDSLRANYRNSNEELVLVDYGYCVCTGVGNVSTVDYEDGTPGDAYIGYTPTNGYVVRNCYVNNCEGTAIDSHGASNVIYEGNTLIDCDSFITAYWDYKRVKTAENWAMENIIVRNNYCKTTKEFDYQNNGYPHNPFMLHSNGPMGKMQNVVVENNVVDTNWYYLNSNNEPWNMVEIYWVSNISFKNNVFKSTAPSAALTRIQSCFNCEIDNTTLIGNFERGITFYTAKCKLGHFDCNQATFSNAMFVAVEGFFSVVDTDSLVVIPAIDNMFSGWNSVLNRYGHPLEREDGILPLDGTLCTYKGFSGKTFSAFPTIISRTNNTLTTGSCRFLPGTRIILGDSAYYVVKVESSNDRTEYTYTLDKDLNTSGNEATSIQLSRPYISKYNAWAESGANWATDGCKETITLPVSGWSANAPYTQTVDVLRVTTKNDIFVAPTSSSHVAYNEAKVYCSAQAANTLTFTCSQIPSKDLTVNVLIQG